MLPESIAAWAFFIQLPVNDEEPLQSMGKKVTPWGRVPPVTDAQLYAHEALLYRPLSVSVEERRLGKRRTHPDAKPLSRFTSLYDKPRLLPELLEAGGVEAGALEVCVVGLKESFSQQIIVELCTNIIIMIH